MSHRTNIPAPIRKLHRCSNRVQDFSQHNWKIPLLSKTHKSLNQLGWNNHKRSYPRRPSSSKKCQQSNTGRGARVSSPLLATDRWTAKTNKQWANLLHKSFTNPEVIQEVYQFSIFQRLLGVARVGKIFDVIVHQKRLSDTEKLHYLKIIFTGQAKATISWLCFSSLAFYQAWDILCKKFVRPRIKFESQLKKTYTHIPVWHDDSSRVVRFANVVTNTINVLIRLGFQHDLELEGVLSSSIRKFSPQHTE